VYFDNGKGNKIHVLTKKTKKFTSKKEAEAVVGSNHPTLSTSFSVRELQYCFEFNF
jgi:hypothetical protein